VRKSEFESYVELRRKLEERAVELCHLYVRAYYGVEEDERDIVITEIEVGPSGRVMFTYAIGDLDETLYLPPEYLWRTDEEVLVLMQIDSEVKDEAMKRHRARSASPGAEEAKKHEQGGNGDDGRTRSPAEPQLHVGPGLLYRVHRLRSPGTAGHDLRS
jgi:hypothetical protein